MPVFKRKSDQQVAPTGLTPYWQSECRRVIVYVGDCRNVMAQMEPEKFHAVVTDPPYEIGFMGKKWDSTGIASDVVMWESVLRAAKPGAHLLSFGGSRSSHRMVCAVEDAGFEIRDTIMWVYGSGFPKGADISQAIDKVMGAKREKIRTSMGLNSNVFMDGIGLKRPWKEVAKAIGYHEHDGCKPVTEEAKQWTGYNTTLKPAYEPIILARKPIPDTVAQCVLDHGTGGLNIDGCRIGTDKMNATVSNGVIVSQNTSMSGPNTERTDAGTKTGRWPTNFVHDGSDEVVVLFPLTAPSRRQFIGSGRHDKGNIIYGKYGDIRSERGYDTGGGTAARFFYTAKADDSDRPHGKKAAIHPTVKPLDLMRYLVRLVCAPGGTVFDPFMGSGSTGCAAILERMRFVGIEQSEEYADIAIGRLKLVLLDRKPEDAPQLHTRTVRRMDSIPLPPRKMRGTS